MVWQRFLGISVPPTNSIALKRRYSVTSDVISYQRCPRQYGYFAVRGFEPAHSVQIYYGTVIHQVLDFAHRHYAGLIDPQTQGRIPTDDDIAEWFDEVHNSLELRNIRSVRRAEQIAALRRLQNFNRIEGPTLYSRVVDTEHRLQSDRGNYLLHGTVDLLVEDNQLLPGLGQEIWDYKGGRRPSPNSEDFRRYEFQMLVYGELYKERNGIYPQRAVLYFLAELDNQTSRPPNAAMTVQFDAARIQQALLDFDRTVGMIENARNTDSWPAPAPVDKPDKQTCDICDLRWSCTAVANEYQPRFP